MAITDDIQCLRCGGMRVVRGRLAESVLFRPGPIKRFVWRLTWLDPLTRIEGPGQVCLDCGLFWTSVDAADLTKRLRIWGDDALKAQMGLLDKKPVGYGDELA